MQQRIRIATIITNDGKILLVKHVHPETGYTWWVPPGGGIESRDDSIFDCAKREVFEEVSLTVEISRIIYIREYLDRRELLDHGKDILNLEIFVLADSYDGEVGIQNIKGNGPDELYIQEVKWFSEEEIADIVVYPEVLKGSFWKDLKKGFTGATYLGRQG